jgi:hypothetical protein
VVVVFALVAHGTDDRGSLVHDLAQCHVACVAERDDPFAQERASAGLATGERLPAAAHTVDCATATRGARRRNLN